MATEKGLAVSSAARKSGKEYREQGKESLCALVDRFGRHITDIVQVKGRCLSGAMEATEMTSSKINKAIGFRDDDSPTANTNARGNATLPPNGLCTQVAQNHFCMSMHS